MSRRPSLALVLGLLLAGLCAFAQRQAHVMGVQHEWCGEHSAWAHAPCEGELPELSPCETAHTGERHEEERPTEEGEGHDHCTWILLDELRAQSPALPLNVLVERGPAVFRREDPQPAAPAQAGPPLLDLAPKNSPPA